jgi:hypothetical protein
MEPLSCNLPGDAEKTLNDLRENYSCFNGDCNRALLFGQPCIIQTLNSKLIR